MVHPSFQPLISTGDPVEGKVKWFSSAKGFGFIALPDGSEAFLHGSALQAAGIPSPGEGAVIKCEIGAGKKGPQVTRVIAISGGTAPVQRTSQMRQDRYIDNTPPVGTVEVEGAVKWFSVERGYGFVTADDGGADIFVHGDYVRRAGLQALLGAQRVSIAVTTTPKGREARGVRVLEG